MKEEFALQVLHPDTDIHYSMRSSFQGTLFPHRHDFYEFFLVIEGRQEYRLANKVHTLLPGALVLVRPAEAHARRYLEKGLHINVAFSCQVAQALFSYLGEGFPQNELLDTSNFPYAMLSKVEKEALINRLEEIGATNLKQLDLIRTRLRIILFDLFVNHFSNYLPAKKVNVQDWFEILLEKMQSKNNFVAGVPRMVQLSGKSSEHLCRVFKKRLQRTPTEYVNSLRINYAASLLTHSDKEILDICLSSGFESLSHFYHIFNREFGVSPSNYRKNNTVTLPATE